MKKIIVLLVLLVLVCTALFTVVSCTNYNNISNVVKNYSTENVVLESGKSHEFDLEKIFKNSGLNVTKYEIDKGDFYTVDGNKITAKGTGRCPIMVSLYVKSEGCRYMCSLGTLYSYDRKDMTPVSTAQELASIKDMNGAYIQTADIDLSSVKDWQPIGNLPATNSFKGIFVNPDGYKISNLTINSSANVPQGPYGGCLGGLFGNLDGALVYGVIVENAQINLGDFTGKGNSSAGVIAASTLSCYIKDCIVSGDVAATGSTGGIIGSMSWGCIEGCEFDGTVSNIGRTDENFNDSESVCAGGIVGYCGIPYDMGQNTWGMIGCRATCVVMAEKRAGGIAGTIWGVDFVKECSFEEEGYTGMPMYGYVK